MPDEIWLSNYWKTKTVWNIIGKNRKIGTLTFSQWSISLKIIMFTQFFVQIATSLIFDLSKVLFVFILPKWCLSFIFLRWCFFFAFFLYCSAIAHQRDLIGGYFFFDNGWTWWRGVVRYHELIDPVKYEIYLHKCPLERWFDKTPQN